MYHIRCRGSTDEDWDFPAFLVNDVTFDEDETPIKTPHGLADASLHIVFKVEPDDLTGIEASTSNDRIAKGSAAGTFSISIPQAAVAALIVGQTVTGDVVLTEGPHISTLCRISVEVHEVHDD